MVLANPMIKPYTHMVLTNPNPILYSALTCPFRKFSQVVPRGHMSAQSLDV